MHRQQFDIVVSGGGVAGLAAAGAFGALGLSVLCVDPSPPVTDAEATGADLRTTAILQPGRRVLEASGLWQRLESHATPLQVMRIVDAGGDGAEPRVTHDFDSADVSDLPFGWNLPNWLLRREMVAHLAALPTVAFRPGTGTTRVITREGAAIVGLSDGSTVAARLLVAADGRNSPVRDALGIGVTTLRYGQKALAFAVTHPKLHHNVSTEIHRSGGPFTLVPLPDRESSPCSAVVWMERGAEIRRLMELPQAAFEREMSERSAWVLGPLSLASRLTVWPIISQIAERLTGQRSALMAEAAHVVPPIGAQGLNMSLADLAALVDLVRDRPENLGTPTMLAAYERRRIGDIRMRVTGIDALNRASMAGARPLRDARAVGLNLLYGVAPVRRGLMRLGMGMAG